MSESSWVLWWMFESPHFALSLSCQRTERVWRNERGREHPGMDRGTIDMNTNTIRLVWWRIRRGKRRGAQEDWRGEGRQISQWREISRQQDAKSETLPRSTIQCEAPDQLGIMKLKWSFGDTILHSRSLKIRVINMRGLETKRQKKRITKNHEESRRAV